MASSPDRTRPQWSRATRFKAAAVQDAIAELTCCSQAMQTPSILPASLIAALAQVQEDLCGLLLEQRGTPVQQ